MALRRKQLCQNLDVGLLDPRAVGWYISVVQATPSVVLSCISHSKPIQLASASVSSFLQGSTEKRRKGSLRLCKARWFYSRIIPGNPNGVFINETTGPYLSWFSDFCHFNKQCLLAHNNCALASWFVVNWLNNLADTCQFCACLQKNTSELGWEAVSEKVFLEFPVGSMAGLPMSLVTSGCEVGEGSKGWDQKDCLRGSLSLLGWMASLHCIPFHLKRA